MGIGDFSRATFITVKALRHYHEIGLLEPRSIDPSSGYRRYATDQIATAQIIRRLRELGLSLDDVRHVMLTDDVDARQRSIAEHLSRMEDHLARQARTVASLRALVDQGPRGVDITFRRQPRLSTVAISEHISGGELHEWRADALAQLAETVDTVGLTRTGPDAALYSSELLETGAGEVVAFIAVQEGTSAVGRGRSLILEPADYAVARHAGPPQELDQTFGALGRFVSERAISVPGPIREDYLADGAGREEVIDICWPVFRVRA